MSAQPAPAQEAAGQVLAGDPRSDARRWLGPLTLVVFILFAIDTYLVYAHEVLPFDVPVAVFLQSFPWGPITYVFNFTNNTAGFWQGAAGVVAVVALFIWERRAGYLMALGAIGSLLDNEIKVLLARQRPTADLVHILTPAPGYSYPSGHAVFFTWMSFMLAFALAPHVKARWRPVLWIAAAVIIVLACIARVWAGAHWPSDVIGGFLLGLGWSAFVVWVPERWLPTPTRKWFVRFSRKRAAA